MTQALLTLRVDFPFAMPGAARHRHGAGGGAFNDPVYEAYRRCAADIVRERAAELGWTRTAGPVAVGMVTVTERPASMICKHKKACPCEKWNYGERLWDMGTPDLDNRWKTGLDILPSPIAPKAKTRAGVVRKPRDLAKAEAAALAVHAGLIHDDAQVVTVWPTLTKLYGRVGESPWTAMWIVELSPNINDTVFYEREDAFDVNDINPRPGGLADGPHAERVLRMREEIAEETRKKGVNRKRKAGINDLVKAIESGDDDAAQRLSGAMPEKDVARALKRAKVGV